MKLFAIAVNFFALSELFLIPLNNYQTRNHSRAGKFLLVLAGILLAGCLLAGVRAQAYNAGDFDGRLKLNWQSAGLLDNDHSLLQWGCKSDFKNNDAYLTPTRTMSDVKDFSIYTAPNVGCFSVVKTDNTLWTWGTNLNGVLGVSQTSITEPVKIMDNVQKADLSETYGLALKTDGTLWKWGASGDSIYGSFDNYDTTPIQVLDNVKDFALAQSSIAVLKNDGSAWLYSQDVPLSPENSDKFAKGLDGVKYIACEGGRGYGIKNDNTLWVFETASGQNTLEARQIASDAAQVSCGYPDNLYLKTDKTLYSWEFGTDPGKATKIMDNVVDAQVGDSTYTVIKDNGDVYSWGDNIYGEIGNGSSGEDVVNEPVLILSGLAPFGSSGTPSTPSSPSSPDQPSKPDSPSASETIAVCRLYNEAHREHLYTTNPAEISALTQAGWKNEGTGWNSPKSGTPVYRLYSPATGYHLYTTDQNEVNVLTSQKGWQKDFDGQPLFYSGGSVPVYRLYHEGVKVHLLTTDENEYNTLGNQGWNRENIAFYAVSK